jgi:hypothetical protein
MEQRLDADECFQVVVKTWAPVEVGEFYSPVSRREISMKIK